MFVPSSTVSRGARVPATAEVTSWNESEITSHMKPPGTAIETSAPTAGAGTRTARGYIVAPSCCTRSAGFTARPQPRLDAGALRRVRPGRTAGSLGVAAARPTLELREDLRHGRVGAVLVLRAVDQHPRLVGRVEHRDQRQVERVREQLEPVLGE